MLNETPEVIEQQIAATQESLAAKVGDLEQRTLGSVQGTIENVSGTIGAVAGTIGSVQDTVEKIGDLASAESISRVIRDAVAAIPLAETVRRQPWASVGGAVAAGLITGVLVFRPARSPAKVAAATTPPPREPSFLSGLFDRLAEQFGSQLEQTTKKALDTVGEKAVQHLSGLIPNVPAGSPAEANGSTNGTSRAGGGLT